MKTAQGIAAAFVVALASGALFSWMGLPIPWLLGPMIGACLVSKMLKSVKLAWPTPFRDTGLIIVGYTIALSFTGRTLRDFAAQLPSMLLLTLLLFLLSVLIAYAISRWTGIPFPTALSGSIPGGLTQMIALAEETRGIDVTVVAFLQVSRLMMIVSVVPLLIFSPITGASHPVEAILPSAGLAGWPGLFPEILPYAFVCVAAALIGRRFRFPTAFLLAPLLAAASLKLAGLPAPPLPGSMVGAAQLLIGCHIGLMLRTERLPNKLRIVTLSIAGGTVLIAGACGLGYLMTKLHSVSAATALLSLSPGGMDQMGIIAHEIDADVATVTGYQLFRTFFIFFAVPPLLRILFSRLSRRRRRDAAP
ncbi:AbrB family transcriptional regulator [Cohnella boryungensis]|uniref:AbrB family transcriptional regulator n=1 Tax=Cohnella boryungensis TaxID=768479 RepID=A0ABV8SIJ0_9BACL